jgi:hypothetical protein
MSQDKDEKRWLLVIQVAVVFWVFLLMALTFAANHAR